MWTITVFTKYVKNARDFSHDRFKEDLGELEMALKEKKAVDLPEEGKEYKCFRCGCVHNKNIEKYFYQSKWSEMFKKNDGYITICKDCVNEMFTEESNRYGEEMATILMCHRVDVPFYYTLYRSIIEKNNFFKFGLYLRHMNGGQYQFKTFNQTILEGELNKSDSDLRDQTELKWTKEEISNKDKVIEMVGYDPFETYKEIDRKYLFNELIKYFDDDIENDAYKLSQIVQIVTNNVQIRNCDSVISSLEPIKDASKIKELNGIKKDLVSSNDKIAKENEISVKNRSDKQVGKNSLTYLMKDLRQRNFDRAEADYYDQLKSEGTKWATDISMEYVIKHCLFDENDKKEIYEENLKLLRETTEELDDCKENLRLKTKEADRLELLLKKYKSLIPADRLGELDGDGCE